MDWRNIKTTKAKATDGSLVKQAPHQESDLSLNWKPVNLTNEPRELTVSANLMQLRNQWEARNCQQSSFRQFGVLFEVRTEFLNNI
jgi:hypothetical protein